jgi:hypothetical protein
MVCVLHPAGWWQHLQSPGWRLLPIVVGGAPLPVRRDELCSTLVVQRLRRSLTRRHRRRSADPHAASGGGGGAGGEGGCAGGGGGGSIGSASASPAPEPSLGLAGHVVLKVLVGLLQTFEGCCVLVIADAGKPDVVGPEVRSCRKEGCDVGNELP